METICEVLKITYKINRKIELKTEN